MTTLSLPNTSGYNLIDYSLRGGLVAATACTVVPQLAAIITPVISKAGSIMVDTFFFFFFSM
jgi:hypothetical protein